MKYKPGTLITIDGNNPNLGKIGLSRLLYSDCSTLYTKIVRPRGATYPFPPDFGTYYRCLTLHASPAGKEGCTITVPDSMFAPTASLQTKLGL